MTALVERLGFAPGERVAVVHADDVGLCEGTVSAFAELAALGTVSSGSVMATAPGFASAAAWARRHPEADLGVHLTLTSEWEGARWGALSTRDPASGMVDGDGGLPRTAEAVARRARPAAAAAEMAAQHERAQAAGIGPTHLDAHMYAALAPPLLGAMVELALSRRLVPVVWRPAARRWPGWDEAAAESFAAELERRGVPLLDGVASIHSGDDPQHAADRVLAVFESLAPGVHHLLLHPAVDTPELRGIAGDWRQRVADYHAFRQPRLARRLRALGIRLVGYRQLAELLPELPLMAAGGG